MLQKKIYKKFTETQQFINKAYLEECCKESKLTSYFVVLIIIVNVVILLYGLLWNSLFSFIYYRLNILATKRSLKNIEKTKK